jgi:hypothetical protein
MGPTVYFCISIDRWYPHTSWFLVSYLYSIVKINVRGRCYLQVSHCWFKSGSKLRFISSFLRCLVLIRLLIRIRIRTDDTGGEILSRCIGHHRNDTQRRYTASLDSPYGLSIGGSAMHVAHVRPCPWAEWIICRLSLWVALPESRDDSRVAGQTNILQKHACRWKFYGGNWVTGYVYIATPSWRLKDW